MSAAKQRMPGDGMENQQQVCPRKQKKARQPRRKRRPSKAIFNTFNFIPHIDLPVGGFSKSSLVQHTPEHRPVSSHTPLTWCPWCGYGCKMPEKHLQMYWSQKRSLYHAALSRNSLMLEEMLRQRQGDEGIGWQEELRNALSVSLRSGSQVITRMLLQAGARPDVTAVQMAALAGHVTLLNLLHGVGTQWDLPDSQRGYTALHIAAEVGRQDVVRFLLDCGANTACKDNNGKTPLHLAARYEQLPVLKLLLAAGADKEVRDKAGHAPWMDALYAFNATPVQLLLTPDVTLSALDQGLLQACRAGSKCCVEELIARGADPGAIVEGDTPILAAMTTVGSQQVVHYLLRHHSSQLRLCHVGTVGHSALTWTLNNSRFSSFSCECDSVKDDETLRLLQQAGVDVNTPHGPYMQPPLVQYISEPAKVRWLLDAGADVNVTLPDGTTLLHAAVVARNEASLMVLFAANIDLRLSACECEGQTPLVMSLEQGHTHLSRLLLQHGVSLRGVAAWMKSQNGQDAPNDPGWPALKTYLQAASSSPRPLMDCARVAVLGQLGRMGHGKDSVHRLPLPPIVQHYLTPEGFKECNGLTY